MRMRSFMAVACTAALIGPPSAASELKTKDIKIDVEAYLKATEGKYKRGEEEYYARLALAQALEAYKEGNYAIGAVILFVTDTKVYEFTARNMMVKGAGVADHAEARGLMVARSYAIANNLIKGREVDPWIDVKKLPKPVVYDKNENEFTKRLARGLHSYGSLEPCPMCLCMMLNSGIKVSISSAEDPLGAYAFDEKIRDGRSPPGWREIRKSQQLNGQVIRLISTKDKRLTELSLQIFLETREEIDKILAHQK